MYKIIKTIKHDETITFFIKKSSPRTLCIRKENERFFAEIKKSFESADSTGNKLLQELERASEGML